MTTQAPAQVPEGFSGSLPEFIVLATLIELGKRPGVDFDYQSALMGGRLEKGGVIVDFLFSDPPDLGISVLGEYFHYGFGPEAKARDIMAREQLATLGITLIFIDESDVLSDPRFYVQAALRYRDHSKLTRG
jgi:hypothetical protein